MMRAFFGIVRRDLALAARIGGGGVLGLVFFLIVVTLIPIALGPDPKLIERVGPATLWIGALLATLIGLDRLFQADEEDGSLDLIASSPLPLELSVFAKIAAHWLTTGLPLALAVPVLGLLVALPPGAMTGVAATILVGTPGITAIGAVGAALTATLRRGGLIIAVIAAPLMVPAVIFGVSAASTLTGGTTAFATPFLFLCALTLVSLVIGTLGAAAALRHRD